MNIAVITSLAALLAGTAVANNGSVTGSGSVGVTSGAGCWEVSVEHDATYCIDGPICSGFGLEPTGWQCPVQGDMATADCHDYLVSYGSDGCKLPVNTTCEVIKTGSWGCVLSPGGSANGNGSTTVNATVLATNVASATSSAAGVVAAIAAGAACVAAIAGFALYKQHEKNLAEDAELAHQHTFVDVVTP